MLSWQSPDLNGKPKFVSEVITTEDIYVGVPFSIFSRRIQVKNYQVKFDDKFFRSFRIQFFINSQKIGFFLEYDLQTAPFSQSKSTGGLEGPRKIKRGLRERSPPQGEQLTFLGQIHFFLA